jgi:hypothetical protein
MSRILGIDPGLSGALATFDTSDRSVEVFDMPTYYTKVNGRNSGTTDCNSLARLLFKIGLNDGADIAFLEHIHTMPKDAAASAGKLMENFGALRGILAAYEIPVTLVRPLQWKKVMSLTSDKELSRRRASELLPHAAHLWPLKKHDGRAEAVLLAVYGAGVVAPAGHK